MALPRQDEALPLRRLEPHWNHGMIAASIAISLLGAFTSTQLYVIPEALKDSSVGIACSNKTYRMCQARVSIGLRTVFVWTLLASLTFGFCSIWSLHFVAMLAYELDILVGINVAWTILSSVLAVVFTFAALGSDLLWDAYYRESQKKDKNKRKRKRTNNTKSRSRREGPVIESRPLLGNTGNVADVAAGLRSPNLTFDGRGDVDLEENRPSTDIDQDDSPTPLRDLVEQQSSKTLTSPIVMEASVSPLLYNLEPVQRFARDGAESTTTALTDSGEHSVSGQSSLLGSISRTSTTSTFGLSSIMNIAYRSTAPAKNVFIATAEVIYRGFTRKNIGRAFLWSLAITSMHYCGLGALEIPQGFCKLNYVLVLASGIISWLVCVVGCILMSEVCSISRESLRFKPCCWIFESLELEKCAGLY